MEVISVINVFGFSSLKLSLHKYYKKVWKKSSYTIYESSLNIRAASFSKGDPF